MVIKNTNLGSLKASLNKIKINGPAPVHQWNPKYCGDLDIRIARNGTWFYNGSPIVRNSLIKVFSNILKKEGDKYFLVTPVEKVGISVEDVPFLATDFSKIGNGKHQTISFETSLGSEINLNSEHPLRITFDKTTGEPSPYFLVRDNLEALIDRKSFYRLFESTTQEIYNKETWHGIWSNNTFFPFIRSKELEF